MKAAPQVAKVQKLLRKFVHDLNNLLVGIEGNARLMLEERFLSEEGRDCLEQIILCSERASHLTREMHSSEELLTEELDDPDKGRPELTLVTPLVRNKVLVIDDEEVVRSVSAAILKRAGFTVLCAETGAEGLSLFEEQQSEIVCVILDLTMPYMSGNLVFARLKAIDPEVKVYLMSGYPDKQVLGQFGAGAIQGFIQKPFGADELVQRVKDCQETKDHFAEVVNR